MIRSFLTALSFLTILPVGRKKEIEAKEFARSMIFFPVVGFFIGLILYLSYYVLSSLFPKSLSIWFIIGILIFLTRGLHLDGFADTMDGLASGGSKERILEVMRDSRIGSFGVFSLIFLIGTKYLILNQIPDPSIYSSLILMTVLGRNSIVLVCCRSPYARLGNGLGKLFTENSGYREVISSSLITLAITIFIRGLSGIWLFLMISLFSIGYRFYFIKRLGGVTGDILGASNEVAELLSIVILLIMK